MTIETDGRYLVCAAGDLLPESSSPYDWNKVVPGNPPACSATRRLVEFLIRGRANDLFVAPANTLIWEELGPSTITYWRFANV